MRVSAMITQSQANQFSELLGLVETEVEDMTFVEGVGIFLVICSTRREAVCPHCGQPSRHLHQNHWYSIEDLPWNEQAVVLRVNRRQFWCQRCENVFSEELPYVQKNRLYTQRLANQIVSQVLGSSIHSVAARTGLSDEQIGTMLKDAGAAYLPERPKSLKYLGMDEIAVVKGGRGYYGVLVNLETHQPITLLPSRTQAALREVFNRWGPEVLAGIEGVSLDLWKHYRSLVEEMMPNATVVADRFHVIQRLNDELDEQRKAEKRAAQKIGNKAERERFLKGLTGSKYVLLKNEEDLTEPQKAKLIEVGKVAPQLVKMHRLKEVFRDIFETAENWAEGTWRLLDWMVEALPFFKHTCGTIKRWFGEVTAYFELRITNGVVEGINNKFKLIERLGYGFHDFNNFKLRSLLPWFFPFKAA